MKKFTIEEYFKQSIFINPIVILNFMLIVLCCHSSFKMAFSFENSYSDHPDREFYDFEELAAENYDIFLDMSQNLLPYIAAYELLFCCMVCT